MATSTPAASVKLTDLASRAGCAAKLGPGTLAQVLAPLSMQSHPDLLVGLQTSDDAAVYQLSPDLALIQTIDFFTPIVDDPWTFGAIAAANALSDVYAMGGEVRLALNVAAFPDDFAAEIIAAIFAGAAAKVEEAGGIIAGGHTIVDAEPKFGLSVTGTVHPTRFLTKAGAKPGDTLVLTKPLGTGLVVTAHKRGAASAAAIAAAESSMLTLNRLAADTLRSIPDVHACTDVTGFGLLGHGSEIASKSGCLLRIEAGAVPVLPGALEAAAAGHQAAGLHRNRAYYQTAGGGIRLDLAINSARQDVLFDPQTSGGLLIAVATGSLSRLTSAFTAAEIPHWIIGSVAAGAGIDVTP